MLSSRQVFKKLNPAQKMNLASYIDYTVLKADCRPEEAEQVCKEAVTNGYAAVCVPPFYVKQAAALLEGQPVKTATFVGFPMGYAPTPAKVEEIKRAIDDGADEVEASTNLCAVKSKNWNFVANDIDSMATAAHLKGKTIKIILETGLLTEEEVRRLCKIAIDAQVDYIKAGSGFNGQETSVEAIQLLRSIVGDKVKVKAFGGIQTRQDVERFVEAGARRVGVLAGIPILA